MIEHVDYLLNAAVLSSEHTVWDNLNASVTFSCPNERFRQEPGLLTALDRCFRLQRRAASVRPAGLGAVAKWLRQRIANPLSPVRIRAAPFLSHLTAAQQLCCQGLKGIRSSAVNLVHFATRLTLDYGIATA